MMVHHEGVIKEDSSIRDISNSDQVPDNVLEQIMRAPNLNQVLSLFWRQILPLTIFKS